MSCKPAFIQLSKTDFGPEYIKTREFEEQFSMALMDKVGGIGGTGEEIVVRWFKANKDNNQMRFMSLDNETCESLPDGSEFQKISDEITPEEFRQHLLGLGYKDYSQVI